MVREMTLTFEPLREHHRTPVIDIFNHYIEHSYAAFLDRKVPYDFYDKLIAGMKGYPSAAVIAGGETAGFCFLRAHNPLPAFAGAADITYFIAPGLTRRGLGSAALEYLIGAARPGGINSIMASVSSLNTVSSGFHIKHGFTECGRFIGIGRKFGREFDVVWFQKKI